MKQNNTTKENIIIWSLVAVGALIYISLIFNNNLWMDEAFSSVLVRNKSFAEVIRASADDTLPPLYNILNWAVTSVFGFKAWVMKLGSVVPMILTMVLGATVVRRRFNNLTAALFIVCMWGMPQLLYYGLEIRMYALGFFFVTAAGIFAIEVYYNPGSLVPYIPLLVCTLGAGYTHHFALVATGFVYGFLMLFFIIKRRKELGRFFLNVLLLGILYFPCLLTTLKQMKKVSGYFTMPDMSIGFVWQCIKLPFTTEITALSALLLLAFIILVVFVIYSLIVKGIIEKDKSITEKSLIALACIGVYGCVIAFGVLATVALKTNIFSERYLVPSLGLLWLGASIAVSALVKNGWLLVAIFAMVIACVAKLYSVQFLSEYDKGVSAMEDYFLENVSEGDGYIIYEDNYQIEICFRYYFPGFKKINWEDAKDFSGNLWYIEVPEYQDETKTIAENGYKSEKAGDFSFDRYSFSLYKLSKQ